MLSLLRQVKAERLVAVLHPTASAVRSVVSELANDALRRLQHPQPCLQSGENIVLRVEGGVPWGDLSQSATSPAAALTPVLAAYSAFPSLPALSLLGHFLGPGHRTWRLLLKAWVEADQWATGYGEGVS